jgi:flagellin-specific chaperone FliS
MLALRNPQDAYRQVDFNARVHGASPHQLVDLCLEQLGVAIDRSLAAAAIGDNIVKSSSLARATAALTTLILGIDPTSPVSGALSQLYRSARRTVLDNAVHFDRAALSQIRIDFDDVRSALLAAVPPHPAG